MNTNDYKYIIKIAELGSCSAAAKELFITQPSLSQRVKYIEAEYGITLFSREKSGMRLTPEGERFFRYAVRIVNNESDLRMELSNQRENQPTLRLGVSWLIDSYLSQSMVMHIHKIAPQTHFEIVEQCSASLQASLLNNHLDLIICYLPITSPDISYRIILNDSYILLPAVGGLLERRLKSQNIAAGAYISPLLLNGEPIAACSDGSMLRNYLTSVMENDQITPDIRHTIKSIPMLYSFAEMGISSTVLYQSFIPGENAIPYYYLDSKVSNSLSVALAWRKDSQFSSYAKDLSQVIRTFPCYTQSFQKQSGFSGEKPIS